MYYSDMLEENVQILRLSSLHDNFSTIGITLYLEPGRR